MSKQKQIQTTSLDEIADKYIGKRGTPGREEFESELQAEMLGELIKKARKKAGLTQEELGEKVGVQKAWISKLENNPANMTVSTLLSVLGALNTKMVLRLEMKDARGKTSFV
jgi:ribosome-binding protein aMBF1 (putative translation factor)